MNTKTGSTRIAVVDDNEDTLALMGQVLMEHDWEMIPCPDGETAFQRLKEERPDAIVLDLWLDRPDSGWSILRQLKDDPATQHIPVVMCSGNRDSLEDNTALIDQYAAAVLVKPFDIEDAYRSLEHALSTSKQPR